MPKKKNEPNKSAFVRSQPAALPAAEVVAKAKEAGLAITPVLVYKVRAKQKAKSGGKSKKKASGAASPRAKRAGGKLSASAFIRSLPSSLSAKEVVEKGASGGYSFKTGLVYDVRGAMKKRQAKAAKGGHPKSAPAASVKASSKAVTTATQSLHRTKFRSLMIDLGLTQAEALYADVHRELKAIRDRG